MKKLGIIGGIGPLASSYFYEMLTKRNIASKDQDHLNIVLLSHPEIPDRTEYILDNTKESPLPYLLEDIKTLENLNVDMIAIPCNTSHYFYDELQKSANVKINNMIEDTVEYLKRNNIKRVGVLATSGTIKTHLYQIYLEKNEIDYVLPDEAHQKLVMDIIYKYVKSGKKVNKEDLDKVVESLNVDNIILGCTELSLLKKEFNLNDNYIDPLEIETEKILKYFGKEYRKEEI